jgi:hypothetical protein
VYGLHDQWRYRHRGFESKRHSLSREWFDVSARIANQ